MRWHRSEDGRGAAWQRKAGKADGLSFARFLPIRRVQPHSDQNRVMTIQQAGTLVSRGSKGKGSVVAVSKFPLGFDRRELVISTSKRVFGPGIATSAKVVQLSADGNLALGAPEDFNRLVDERVRARASEKSVLDLHHSVLKNVDILIADATEFYG